MRNLIVVSALAAMALPVAAHAQQIVLAPVNVIGSSGSYGGTQFNASHILDGQTGQVADLFNNYWLNPDGGTYTPFITIDLGASYSLTSFTLFNTTNGVYNDRNTGNFSIVGSNSIVSTGTGTDLTGVTGFTLADAFTLASGTLAAGPANNPDIPGQSFASLSSSPFRYIQFRPTSVTAPNAGAQDEYGLNELRVFGNLPVAGAVPEPASWAMMIGGLGLVGGAMRRRPRAQARFA